MNKRSYMSKITFNLLFGEFILQNNKRNLISNSNSNQVVSGEKVNGKETEESWKQSLMFRILRRTRNRWKPGKSVNSNYCSIDPWQDLNDVHCPLPNIFLDSEFIFKNVSSMSDTSDKMVPQYPFQFAQRLRFQAFLQ